MKQISKRQFSKGIMWKTVNLILSKGLSFFASIIIARRIELEHYGYMAIWSAILSFSDVLLIGGLDTVLVQKSDIDKDDWSTGLGLILYKSFVVSMVLWISAPFISKFYDISALTTLLRITCIDLVSQPFIIIAVAKYTRKLDYKKIFLADFVATVVGGIVSFLLIFIKKNLYVLVLNNMVHQAIYAFVLFLMMEDKVLPSLNGRSLGFILRDGTKAMSNGVLDLAVTFVSTLYIGKKWQPSEVGYNNKAQSLVQVLGVETYNVVSAVLLPTFSYYQNEEKRLKDISRIMISFSTYIMFPLMFGMAVCARHIILFLFTEKWIQAVPFLQLSCIYYAFNPLRQLCMNLNYSNGKYKVNNIIETLRFVFNILILVLFQIFELHNLQLFVLMGSIIAVIVAICYLLVIRSIIDYKIIEIAQDIVPNFVISFISLIPVMFINRIMNNSIIALLFSILSAVGMYIIISIVTRNRMFLYILNSIKEIIGKK